MAGTNWNKTADRKAAKKSGNAVSHAKGQGGVGYPIKTKKDAQDAATLLKIHGGKYSPAKRAKIKAHIRKHAKNLGATVNLASADGTTDFGNNKTGAGQATGTGMKGQAGKTRAQPRAFGGKFGKKGKSSGEQAMPDATQTDPETYTAVVNVLQIGQSVALPGSNAKVKRLGSGYQLVKMDGSENTVVKSINEANNWVRKNVKTPKGGKNDGNQPAT